MINTKHFLKVTSAWISVVYLVCFFGVALIPGIRTVFMKYALHQNALMGRDVITITSLVSGLIIWNIVALLAAWLFAALFNWFKQ